MKPNSIINNVQLTGHVYRGPVALANSQVYYMRMDNGGIAKVKFNDSLSINQRVLVDGTLDSSWASTIQANVMYIVACSVKVLGE